jgi:hypothetical protein
MEAAYLVGETRQTDGRTDRLVGSIGLPSPTPEIDGTINLA